MKTNPKTSFYSSKIKTLLFLVGLTFFNDYFINAQEPPSRNFVTSVGIHIGISSQKSFLGNDPDYLHENRFINLQLTHLVKKKGNWNFETLIQPTYYNTTHQLLNPFYIKPSDYENFQEIRDRFTQAYDYEEYTLYAGLQMRYNFTRAISLYTIGMVGLQISSASTERLRKGFTFSDVVGLGTSYQYKKLRWDVRASFIHTSNAQLSSPNAGHNSFSIETGISFLFDSDSHY